MEHKFKMLEKYIDSIKKNHKTKVYKLFDGKIKQIHSGDSIVIISAQNNDNFVRVIVKDVKYYKSLELVLEDNFKDDVVIREDINEFMQYYSNSEIEKYGIAIFHIAPVSNNFKNSKVLIDKDIIIYRERHSKVNFEIFALYDWFDKLNMTKFIHPLTLEEINNVNNFKLKKEIIFNLNKYQKIDLNSTYDEIFFNKMSEFPHNENKRHEDSMLLQVYNKNVDFLVTNDMNILEKAKKLYLTDRVFFIDDFLKKIEEDNPKLIDYNMLSVKLEKFKNVDLSDSFFDSLRQDYLNFDNWFIKKKDEPVYIFCDDKFIRGFLYLKIEDEFENYSDIVPNFVPKKRLKIGTFKIISSGFRLGERFLKIIFDNAIENDVDEIYVTMFKNKRKDVLSLKRIMKQWGFKNYGYKKSTNEVVLVKDMRKYDLDKDPKYNFPLIKNKSEKYILPICSSYHTDLFPDKILKNENMNLYQDNLAHRYSLEKIYITGSSNNPKPGDIVLIYRNGEIWPKKYSSVLTGIAIVQSVIVPTSLDEYLYLCSNKSVFSEEELKLFYNEKKWRKVINLLDYIVFDKKIILNELYKMNIIELNKGPRPFTKITSEDYYKILEKGMVKKT